MPKPKTAGKTGPHGKTKIIIDRPTTTSSPQVKEIPCQSTSNQAINSHIIPLINRLTVGSVQQGLSAAISSRILFLRSGAADKRYSLYLNMLPFYVHTDEIAPRLYELSDGRFQIVEKGELPPFISGYGYVLVRPDLAEFLDQLEIERLTIEDAIVWDRASNTEYKSYKRLRLNHHFTSDQIKDINVEGIKLLVMDNELVFASPMLTANLRKSHFTYLKFSEGLDGFAAQI